MSETETIEREMTTPTTLPRLGTLVADLRGLTDVMLDEAYDSGFRRPSRSAFEKAWELSVQAEEALCSGVPLSVPAPVGDGGILVQWELNERAVFLAVPADPGEGYLYLRAPDSQRTIRTLSGPALASAVEWLSGE